MSEEIRFVWSRPIFGDGAAAAVFWTRPQGYELVASGKWYVPEQRESIHDVHKKGQLCNQLSTKLPGIVRKATAQIVAYVLVLRSVNDI